MYLQLLFPVSTGPKSADPGKLPHSHSTPKPFVLCLPTTLCLLFLQLGMPSISLPWNSTGRARHSSDPDPSTAAETAVRQTSRERVCSLLEMLRDWLKMEQGSSHQTQAPLGALVAVNSYFYLIWPLLLEMTACHLQNRLSIPLRWQLSVAGNAV